MKLFLDSSVLLAASGSGQGASSELFRRADANDWYLLTTPYVIEEVFANLSKLPNSATSRWAKLRPFLVLMDDVLVLDRVAVFGPAKDRPILFSALAWADVLLTLDREDFGSFLGSEFFGLRIYTPTMFLDIERGAGKSK